MAESTVFQLLFVTFAGHMGKLHRCGCKTSAVAPHIRRTDNTPEVKLLADHFSILQTPPVVTNATPLSVEEHFNSSFMFGWTIDQPHRVVGVWNRNWMQYKNGRLHTIQNCTSEYTTTSHNCFTKKTISVCVCQKIPLPDPNSEK